MPAEEVGSLAQAVLKAYNKLAELKASGAGQLAIRVAENALEKAKLAQQMATGSQQGVADIFRQGAGAAGGGLSGVGSFMPDPASFLTPEFSAQYPEMAGILNAPSLLDQGLAAIFGLFGRGDGGLPNAQQVPGGGPMMQSSPSPLPSIGLTPGGRAPMPTASQPVRFLPSQPQGSQFPGSSMDRQLPGGGTRRPAPQGPRRPSLSASAPKPKPKPRSGPGRRR